MTLDARTVAHALAAMSVAVYPRPRPSPARPFEGVDMNTHAAVPSLRSEEADDYHAVVARLNESWRIIVCAAGI